MNLVAKGHNVLAFVSCGALGSSLMHTAAFRELRKAFPDSRIGIATNDRGVELFRNNPYGIETYDTVGKDDQIDPPFFETLIRIEEQNYDTALVFPSDIRNYMKFVPFYAQFNTRIGLYGGNGPIMKYYSLFADKGYEPQFLERFGFTGFAEGDRDGYIGQYNLSYLKPLGIDVRNLDMRPEVWSSREDIDTIKAYFSCLGITDNDFVLGVNVGGLQGHNTWDINNYIGLINGLFERTGGIIKNKPLRLLINYTGPERGYFEEIMGSMQPHWKEFVSGVPQEMSIGQLAEVIRRCSAFFSTDTGAAHVAQEGTPAVVLYPNRGNEERWRCPQSEVLPLIGNGHVNDIGVERALLSTLLAIYEWEKH